MIRRARSASRGLLLVSASMSGALGAPACQPARSVAASEPFVGASDPGAAAARDWDAVFTRTSGWTGADGAGTVELPGGRLIWLFGDSWIGPVQDGRHAAGSVIVNNTIALQLVGPTPPSGGQLEFLWGAADAIGKPTAWVTPVGAGLARSAPWFWPTGGGIVAPGPLGRDRLLVFMTRLARKDASESIWNFEPSASTLLVVDNPAEPPQRWHIEQHAIADARDATGRQVTWGAAALTAPEGQLIVFGIDASSTRDKRVVVARVPAATAEQFVTWRFWDGRDWTDAPASAARVAGPVASEVSIHRLRLRGRERYAMVYADIMFGSRILSRTAPSPEGPWSGPVTLYTCPEPGADQRLFVYAAKAHPELSRPGELLVSYSVNSNDFWDVAAHADKYRPRFVRVSERTLEPKP